MGGGLWRWMFGAGAIATLFAACGGDVEGGGGHGSGGASGTGGTKDGSNATGGGGSSGKGATGGAGGSSGGAGGSGGSLVGAGGSGGPSGGRGGNSGSFDASGGSGGSGFGGVGGIAGGGTGGSGGTFDAGLNSCESCAIANCGTEYAACTGTCATEVVCIQDCVLSVVASGGVANSATYTVCANSCAVGSTITAQTNNLFTCLAYGVHPDGGVGPGCFTQCLSG